MLDHIVVHVSDLGASRAFYEGALAPLGMGPVLDLTDVAASIGFGRAAKPEFWIREGGPGSPVHVAFGSSDRRTVDVFHEAALAAGGRDNGGPGVREIYHSGYYGAFVLDPDGHNVEAVCHDPSG